MTNAINEYYQKAELAIAAYADNLSMGMNPADYVLALTRTGMSEVQAQQFAATYEIIAQLPNTSSGFSATVFRKNGDYFLAIRGTESFTFTGTIDWLTNVRDIGLKGIAINQALDLFNYFQDLTTQQGSTVYHYAYNLLTNQVTYTSAVASATGALYGQAFTVTGHSLGGHLALIMNRLAPSLVGGLAYTYNAPGFDTTILTSFPFPGSEGFFTLLHDAEVSARGISDIRLGLWESANFHNLVVPEDIVHLIGNVPGGQVPQFSELGASGRPVNSHDKNAMTDALAVYSLLGLIDPAKTDAQVLSVGTNILKAAANTADATLEGVVNAIGDLFGSGPTVITGNRDQLYQRLIALDAKLVDPNTGSLKPEYQGLSLADLAGTDAQAIETDAYADMGYRYGLKKLNPFIIVGNDTIYTQYNQNGELDVYSSTTGSGMLTSQWISDRAKFLGFKVNINTSDQLYAIDATAGTNVWYQDKTIGGDHAYVLTLSLRGNLRSDRAFEGFLSKTDAQRIFFGSDTVGDPLDGGANSDSLYGGGGDDRLNGLAQDDYLQGDAGQDQLYAGTGNDVVVGGKDDDVLDGGLGNDTYVWNTGDGLDAIIDAHEDNGAGIKQGTIQFLNQLLAGVKTQVSADNPGLFTDGQGVLYAFYGVTSGEGTLFITKPGEAGGLTVRGFRSGDFGIDLGPVAPIQKAEKFGTAEADNGSDPNSPIYNDAPNEKLFGLGGDDGFLITKSGTEGYGGTGQDFIYAPDAGGNHKLFGEENRDILITWGGGNELFGGLDDDALTGGIGEDYLEGNDNSDVLAGNLGQDVLIGGDSADYLLGGASYSAGNFNWSVTVIPETHIVLFDQFNGEAFLAGDSGDLLKGEAGADFLWGGEGDDALYGGTEDDYLEGDEDSDLLFGEDGNDTLWGDRDVAPADRHGQDYLDGGAGDDELFGEGDADILIGGAGADYLQGDSETGIGEGADFLEAGVGNDTLRGGGGDDYLDGSDDIDQLVGGAGLDELFGGAGDDLLLGEADDDYLDGEGGADQLSGGDGNDVLFGGIGADTMVGDAGDDYIDGEADNDLIAAGDGNDEIYGDAGLDELQGGIGDDTLDGGADDDLLFGEAGVDVLSGGDSNDQLSGGDDNDTIFGNAGNDTTRGGAGNDFLAGDAGDDMLLGDPGKDILSGGDGIDELQGGADDDTLDGGADNDVLFGETGNDVLSGGEGDDQIVGSDGADTLDGGAGNDTQFGDAGNDTYLFGRGYGQDGIVDQDLAAGNVDRVEFAADITLDAVTASQSFADLMLTVDGTADSLRIYNQFAGDNSYCVEEIRFADGTVWTPTSTPLLIRGTAGNDVLNGTSGPNVFEGLAGNDTISGGTGDDTYRIFRSDGQDIVTDSDSTLGNVDKILYATNILSSEVRAARSGNNLVLALTGTTDQVTVTNYFINDGVTPNSLEQIKFLADSTTWDLNAVKQMVLTGTSGAETITGYGTDDVLTGLGGNDTLVGNAGSDTLNGGTGIDLLQGGSKNDTYLFGREDGQDTISDVDATAGNVDRIQYATDILPSDVRATRSGNNLVLALTGTTDQVTVTNYFENDGVTPSSIERIEFLADGTVWDVATVKSLVLTPTAGDDAITGYATADVLNGLGGNDVLHGAGGNDALDGGVGNDTLLGEDGSDTYLFGRGAGQDTISNSNLDGPGTTDVLSFAPDVMPGDVNVTYSGNDLILSISGTSNQVQIQNYLLSGQNVVEEIRFANGTVWDEATISGMLVGSPINGTAAADALQGTALSEAINGLAGNDTIYGAGGNDTVNGGAGNDRVYGDSGNDLLYAGGSPETFGNITGDVVYGGDGNDYLQGGPGRADLFGGAGNDILEASGGTTVYVRMEDTSGNNLFYSKDNGAGLLGGPGNDFFIGGSAGAGIYTNYTFNPLGDGRDIIAYNKNEKAGPVGWTPPSSSDNTLSIGGGTDYSAMKLERAGHALRFYVTNKNFIQFDGWYGDSINGWAPNSSIGTLQVISESIRGYSPLSTDPLLNKKVQFFDFLGIVSAFNQALAADPRITKWSISGVLSQYRLSGSDSEAIGGALAYQYGLNGTLSSLSLSEVQSIIGDGNFGTAPQPISVTGQTLSATALSTDSVVETMTGMTEHFSLETQCALSEDTSTASFGATDMSNPVGIENPAENASPYSDLLVGPREHWVAHEPLVLVLPHELSAPSQAVSVPSFDQPPVASAASRFHIAGLPGAAEESACTTPAANNAFGATATTSEGFTSGAPSRSIMTDSSAAGSASTDGSGASGTGTRTERDPLAEPLDGLIPNWFARESSHEDLSLLDEIARGEGAENSSAGDAEIAAAWQRSHQWLNGRHNSGSSYGGDDGDGADLGAMSFLGDTGMFIDMPRPAVGLRNVAGHDLKPFSGLQEGVSVLAQ